MIKYFLFICASVLAAAAIFLFRQVKLPLLSIEINFLEIFSILQQPKLWGGFILYGIAFIFFLYIVNVYEISSSVPALLGTYLVVLALMGYFFLGEPLTLAKVIAYCLIITGIFLL